MLKVSEVFWSAQGEGVHSGTSAIFIRLAGCALRCPYCDTRRAWTSGRLMKAEAIVGAAAGLKASHPRARVVVTGGEPLEQDLGELLAACRRRRWVTAVETNGLHFQDLPFDWWTVSPKDVSSFQVHPRLWAKVSEMKLLVTPALELALLKKLRRRTAAPIVLQPERHDRDRYRRAFAFFRACSLAGIPDIRLGLQLHAVFRVP